MIMAFWDVIPCNFEKKSVAIIFRMFYPKDVDVKLLQNIKFTTNKRLRLLFSFSLVREFKKRLLIVTTRLNVNVCIAWLIRQRLQLQAQVTFASLGRCHKSGKYAKSCARRSVRFWNHGAVDVPLFGCLRTSLQSRDWNRRSERFVRLALKVIKENDGNFVDVIVLYTGQTTKHNFHTLCLIYPTSLLLRFCKITGTSPAEVDVRTRIRWHKYEEWAYISFITATFH
jgi:hypothetical protein